MNSKVTFRSAQPSAYLSGAPFSLSLGLRCFAVLIAATLFVACGGGGGDSTPPSASIPVAPSTPTVPSPAPDPVVPARVSLTLGGSISGLGSATGLTLVNGTETLAIAAGANSFTFATQLAPSAAYNVTVATQPSGLSCSVADGSGTLSANVNSVKVSCTQAVPRVSTLAGDGANPIIDGPRASVRFRSPEGVAVDSVGNVYVSDTDDHAIRKITPAGIVNTLAGSINAGYADGDGAAARFSSPRGIAVDSTGHVYVADTGNNAIRKISPSGVVTTLKLLGENNRPYGIAINSAGNIYVSTQYAVMKISTSGEVSTMTSFSGGPMRDLFSSQYLAVDNAGNAYVAERGLVLKVSSSSGNVTPLVLGGLTDSGIVQTTLAGAYDSTGFVDGDGASARFSDSIRGLAVDNVGNVYVADANTIRKITHAGTVTTLAGAGPAVAKGFADGNGASARFNRPVGLALDSTGNLYVADTGNNLIRKVSPSGNVTTHAGSGYTGDSFASPWGVAVDSAGNVYVADTYNNMIRKISPSGISSTLAGAWDIGYVDGLGAGARFNRPFGVAVDSAGNVYVADTYNNAIRKITPAGVVSTLAGDRTNGFVDGTGNLARFYSPTSVAVDNAGNVYVADRDNNAIRKITPAGVVSTLAGDGTNGFVDGTGDLARFYSPTSVAVDNAGYVFEADGNGALRKISPSGVTTTIAPWPSSSFFARGVAVDNAGNLFVADVYGNEIHKISPSGAMTTLAGGTYGFVDGPGTVARFKGPNAVAVDSAGNVYVADTYINAIRKIVP